MMFSVNGQKWKLQFVNANSNQLLRSDGSRTIGVSDNYMKTVFICDSLTDKMTDKVLCHELVHVFSFVHNLSIPMETEEIIADFLSLYGRDIIYLADSLLNSILTNAA